MEIFQRKYRDIIINNNHLIKKDTRFRTGEELKDLIVKNNTNLNKDNFNIIYSTFNKNKFFYKPLMSQTYLVNDVDDFVLVIIDTKIHRGQTYLSILEKNEAEGNYNKYSDYENAKIINRKE